MAEKKKSKKASTTVEGRYGADKLEHLSIREQVRRRPGMWIGNSSSKGLHHLIHEIVDNSVDEFMAGHGDLIEVTITEDQWVTVRDHARGIPVDIHKKSGLSGLELVLTQVGGGGKYGGEDSGYKVSGGLHGAGSSVVNFVSSEMKATVYKDGYEWHQSYKTGIPDGPVKKGKKTKETGTEISWRFDDEIFEKGIKYERETVERRLRELAYLNPGLTITLDFHGHKKAKFYAEGGLSDYMKALVADRDGVEAVHKAPILLSGEVTEEIEKDGMKVEDTTFIDVALYWTTQQNESAHSFVNSINTPEGGTHYDGLRSGLRKALNDAADELGKFRAKDEPFEQVDTREGLFLAVSVKVSDPQFEGQTKGKLNNPEVQKRVHDFVATELKSWLLAKENKSQADRILDRVIEARDGRLAARKAKRAVTERKGLLGASGLPGKLADCFDDQTEVLTDSGWKLFKDVADEDLLATRSPNGRLEYQAPIARIDRPYTGDMLTYESRALCFSVTPTHRMLLVRPNYRDQCFFKFAQDLEGNGRVRVPRVAYFDDRVAAEAPAELGELAKVDHPDFAAFIGIWLAEGKKIAGFGNEVRLTQTKLDGIAWIDDLLERLGWEHARRETEKETVWRINSAPLRSYLEDLQEADDLRLPRDAYQWPLVSQEALLEGLAIGDGRTVNGRHVGFYSTSKKLVDDAQRLLVHMGRIGSVRRQRRAGTIVKSQAFETIATRDLWFVSFYTAADRTGYSVLNGNKIKREPYDGTVYCFEVPNGTLMVRRQGMMMWCGNCRVHDRDQTEIFIVEGDSAGGGMKQARNRETQAVMPLRGKIQNAEKAGEKTLDSEAIKEILLAIGGVVTDIKVPVKKNGKIVNRTKLVVDASSPRYGKIIICSVDGQEMTFVRDAEGKTRCVRIGPFIDELIARGEDVANYQVLCFDQRSHETRFKPLKAVIAHPIEENLYKITTAYGRSVRVTASHSVFVYRDGQVELKRGDEIEVGDQVVIPRTLPLSPGSLPSSLDLVRELHGTHQAEDLWLRGPAVRSLREKRLAATGAHISKKRVSLSQEARQMMREARQAKKYTLRDLAVACGVSEAASVSEWETGRTRPSRQSFAAYCSEVGLDPDALAAKGAVVEPSQLEALQLAHRNSANAQTVRSAIRLSELTEEELNALGSDVTIGSGKHASFALPRFLPLDKDLFFLLGLFIAEGSTGPGVRFSLGPNDDHFIDEIYAASKRLFGQEPRRYESYSDSRGFELRIHNAVAEVLFKQVFGFEGHRSDSKRLPDLFFDAGPELQLECLRGIFLGDGSYGPNGSVIFNTVSSDLASQLVYALASFGVLASHSIVPAQGKMRFPRHSVAVVARSDLAKIKRVWESRPEAAVRAREPVVDDISTVEVSQWPERMTPSEIADALNCSAWTVRTAMREGRLPFEVPAGKSVRDRTAHRDDVLQWAKDRLHSRRSYTEISSDLVAVDVTDVEVVEPSCNKVYDFSVEEDENFVCGTGGVCCHNTDADVDGGHITTLLLTFFFRYARSLIEEGRVYIAELPLYRIEHKTKGRLYLYSDEELQKYVKKDEIKKRGDGLDITRFKGLGEMMPAQLAETALNPETRRLRQVTLDDESEAEDMTTLLMGNRVERRREYIEENATEIEADI